METACLQDPVDILATIRLAPEFKLIYLCTKQQSVVRGIQCKSADTDLLTCLGMDDDLGLRPLWLQAHPNHRRLGKQEVAMNEQGVFSRFAEPDDRVARVEAERWKVVACCAMSSGRTLVVYVGELTIDLLWRHICG